MWWTAHPKKSMCEIAIESQSKAIQKASRSTIPFRVLHPHIMSVHQNEDRDASARREDVSSTLTDHDVTEPSSSGIYSDFFIYREELATFVLAPPPQIPLDDPSTEVAASGSITCSTPEQIQDLQCLSSEELIDQLRPVAQILIDSLNFEQIKEFILSPKPKVGDPNRNPVTHCSRTNEEQESIASADGCFDNGDNDFPAATVQTNTPHATVPRRRDDVSALSEHVPSSSASTASTAPTNRTHESGGADLRAHVGDSHASESPILTLCSHSKAAARSTTEYIGGERGCHNF
ncbi:hypothetical protein BD410DRAFT_454300 [Rickenella mellea]|uniref:Uncharacterized protein n=1 Tax=Rickenella mellea TaxID=50990 RepID=A0A4Y7PVG8_9AGAM|nr:hypothetical protein BD410DRAFT_454300 [Rickenella mellea]